MKEKLKIIPLGGLNEIGKNMTVIEYGNDIVVIDCGLAFPDDDMLGVDLVIPDTTYLKRNQKKVRGYLITHGHEDHIGAIPYVLREVNAPIYATRLTCGIIQTKLAEHRMPEKVRMNTVKAGDVIKLGCFTIEFIHTNHSIADSVALAIRTPDGGTEIPPVLRDAVELRDVSFSYVEGEPVLNHLSVRLEAGKSYAVVGTSGSGKSTFLSLLMGSFPTYTGEILVDGVELREIRLSSLYDLMSLIRQDVFLFQRSLRDNLTMFRDFPEEVVRQAASLAGLGDLVAERGLDFPCGENGNALSGGERQRVSIARSLLRKTPVLLADEATAALDRETAFRVTSSLLDLDGLTRVVVTHSLDEPLLRRFDEILVLRGGVIEERGAFDSLMARKACFYSLMQAGKTES